MLTAWKVHDFCLIHAWKKWKNYKNTEICSVAYVFTLIFHEECKYDIENPLPDF